MGEFARVGMASFVVGRTVGRRAPAGCLALASAAAARPMGTLAEARVNRPALLDTGA